MKNLHEVTRWLISSHATSVAAIRGWVESTRGRDIHTGLSVDKATQRAVTLLTELRQDKREPAFNETDEDLPDVMHALAQLLKLAGNDLSEDRFHTIRAAYEVMKRIPWPVDELGERQGLLADFAFRAWEHSRRYRSYAEMKLWEDRCVAHTTSVDAVQDFLALPPTMRSDQLASRFFSDPCVLLAACSRLSSRRNSAPAEVAEEAPALYSWVVATTDCLTSSECKNFFAGECALLAASSYRLLGMLDEAAKWIERAERHSENTTAPGPMLARASLIRASLLYDRRCCSAALDCIPPLVAQFQKLGMEWELVLARFLEALALKNEGRNCEALQRMECLQAEPAVRRDALLLSLLVVNLGELKAEQGDIESAIGHFNEAISLIESTSSPLAVGYLQGILGQLLRDQNRLDEAIEAYRASISTYARARLVSLESYMRIVAAEALLMAGREHEAAAEVIAALPVIERERLMPDCLAALSLLRVSLQQHGADAAVLRRLRDHLEQVRQKGQF